MCNAYAIHMKKKIIPSVLAIIAIIAIVYSVYTMRTPVAVQMPNAKINIEEVCQGALAYTTFSDGVTAEAFVQDCIDGKHPEVIEQYIQNLDLDGAQI